jgi:hypothetical protein
MSQSELKSEYSNDNTHTNYQKINQMIDFMRSMNNQGARQTLWHGLKVSHAAKQLEQGVLEAHTSHRYWPDGIRRKENDPLYEDSFWMYGWSMTRKREYACGWGSVVFELDAEKIAQSFEVMPISWNNLFSHHKTFQKKEFEEFVISFKDNRTIQNLKDADIQRDNDIDKLEQQQRKVDIDSPEYQALAQQIDALYAKPSWFKEWENPKGRPLDLNKCLKGIYINEEDKKIFEGYEELAVIVNHPLYKGVFEDPHTKNDTRKKPKIS